MDQDQVRQANRATFIKLLGHLGRKEFDEFEGCLHPEFVQRWPYKPLPTLPDQLAGPRIVRNRIEMGMSDFDDYAYTIDSIHDLLDPQMLIAEYVSHSRYRPRDVPYSNRYISVLRFRDGLLQSWTEYVNPLIIKEALLDAFEQTIEERVRQ